MDRKMNFTNGNDSNKIDTCIKLTYVKHIVKFVKITIFTWACEYFQLFYMCLNILDYFYKFLKIYKDLSMKVKILKKIFNITILNVSIHKLKAHESAKKNENKFYL